MKTIWKKDYDGYNDSIKLEKQAMEVLDHPFIVKLHEAYESDRCVCILALTPDISDVALKSLNLSLVFK